MVSAAWRFYFQVGHLHRDGHEFYVSSYQCQD
jgi:hypothetical protein